MKRAGKMVVRVAVIEDDAPTRAAFCHAVAAHADLTLAGEAATHAEAAMLIEAGDYDVLLVDLNLRNRTSFDLIETSRRLWDAPVVVISVLGDEASVVRAISVGAAGYILKDGAFSDLATPILQVMSGECPISPAVARHLLRRFRPGPDGTDAEGLLTRREHQVLAELGRGASYKEIANRYGLSVHTVGDYAKTLYRKLEVTSRGAAVSTAVQRGLIDL